MKLSAGQCKAMSEVLGNISVAKKKNNMPVEITSYLMIAAIILTAIVFADDNPNNLEGAKKIGITTFLYEGFDKFIGQLKNLGVKI